MTTAAAKAAARRKKAKENQASESNTTAHTAKPDDIKKALPTTKLYPKRVPLEVSPEAHERLRRLSYELNKPVNVIIRALIDSSSDEKVREVLNRATK